MFITQDDQVMVIAGKDLGKVGKVLRVDLRKQRAFVEKVNMVKKHLRPSKDNQQGEIREMEGAIHLSNLMLVCPKCNKGVRTGVKVLENNKKVRVCRKCGEEI